MKFWDGLMRYDKRIVERLIHKGIVSREEYENYLKGLKDRKQDAERVRIALSKEGSDGGK